jgi:hypothetical protein
LGAPDFILMVILNTNAGKLYRAGYFKDKDECAAAVRELRESLHGEFARH